MLHYSRLGEECGCCVSDELQSMLILFSQAGEKRSAVIQMKGNESIGFSRVKTNERKWKHRFLQGKNMLMFENGKKHNCVDMII